MKLDSLLWKYGNGCYKGHIQKPTGRIIIDRWDHQTLPRPTAAEILQASDEYDQHLIDQPIKDKKDYKDMKVDLKAKLNMNESQFKIFEKFFKSDKQGE